MPELFDNVQELAREVSSSVTTPPGIQLGRRMAEALLWADDSAGFDQITKGLPIPATRAYIGHQPALVFMGDLSATTEDLIKLAATVAYHSTIHWGIVSNANELTIFNSHWMMNGDWFRLPPISWEQAANNVHILEALTPSLISQGRIEQIASEFATPETLLVPIDDALVERLDHWREEALRHSIKPESVDVDLQTAFAQLFVLRSIEDRDLSLDIPPLMSVFDDAGEMHSEVIGEIFAAAEKQVQSDLFKDITLLRFPPFILSGIINDLYKPHQLPIEGVTYDFSWIRADILGRAYEKYLSNILVPSDLDQPQLQFWEQPLRGAERVTVQKSGGVYYTPPFLVHYIAERSIAEFDAVNPLQPDGKIPRIADFSCGSGSFLVAAADAMIRRLRKLDKSRNWARQLVNEGRIIGIDSDPRAISLARLSLWLRFAEEPDPLPLPRLRDTVVVGDSLSSKTWKQLPKRYDIVVGNPPFIAMQSISNTADLKKRFKVAQGRYDYSYLFVELAIKKLAKRGIIGMVVPNRLYVNKDASLIRELVTENIQLVAVVDFGSTEVFSGTKSYIGVILGQRSDEVGARDPLRVLKVHKLPPRSAGAILYQADASTQDLKNDFLLGFSSPHPIGDDPWLLLSGSDLRARIALEESSVELGSVAGIFQGIRTGANDIFIVELIGDSGSSLVRVRNRLGYEAIVEAQFLHPVVFGSSIRKYQEIKPTIFLIYPYASGRLVPEPQLEQEAPNLLRYLTEYRELLAGRSSIRGSGLKWYELVRKRKEEWLEAPKLLIRDLATETSFAIDIEGRIYLVGGTAVVPAEEANLRPLLGYLNSSVANWYLRSITPTFGSGFKKFEPQHLERLPVPLALISDPDTAAAMAAAVTELIKARSSEDSESISSWESEIELIAATVSGVEIPELL